MYLKSASPTRSSLTSEMINGTGYGTEVDAYAAVSALPARNVERKTYFMVVLIRVKVSGLCICSLRCVF